MRYDSVLTTATQVNLQTKIEVMGTEFENFIWWMRELKRIKHLPSVKKCRELFMEFENSGAQSKIRSVSDQKDEKKICTHSKWSIKAEEYGKLYRYCTECGEFF